MTRAARPLIILLDEGAPVPVAAPFLRNNYQVIYHSDVLNSGAKDELVVAMAILNKAVLIAVDGDMKRMVKRFGSPNSSEKYGNLDLISLTCGEVLATKRVEQAMSFIETEWEVACQKASRRLWLDIGAHRLISNR